MVSIKDFSAAKAFTCSNFLSAVKKAENIRSSGNDENYTIFIQSSICTAQVKIRVSGFYFKSLNSKVEIHGPQSPNYLDGREQELALWKTAAVKIFGNKNIFEGIAFVSEPTSSKDSLIALEVLGTDNLFVNCSFTSALNTLFIGPLPDDLTTKYLSSLPEEECYLEGNRCNFFKQCLIKGAGSFIFGAGQALFDNCQIVTTEADSLSTSTIAAPAHSLKDVIGFVFHRCAFDHELSKIKPVYLASPWRDYGKAVFFYCQYGEHISAEGFTVGENASRSSTARFEEYPQQDGRVAWANHTALKKPRPEINNLILEFSMIHKSR